MGDEFQRSIEMMTMTFPTNPVERIGSFLGFFELSILNCPI
jgi:hypothetical protein